MNKKSFGLGSIIYTEWLLPILNYYSSFRKNEFIYEVISPLIVSIIAVVLYSENNKVDNALTHLANILPSAISILIGFTAMLITILLTSSGENVSILKDKKTDTKLNNQFITLYQKLHIQLSHSLFSEIMLLLIIFLYLFVNGLKVIEVFNNIVLFLTVYLTLNILLSILRGITNIYFSFYNTKNK